MDAFDPFANRSPPVRGARRWGQRVPPGRWSKRPSAGWGSRLMLPAGDPALKGAWPSSTNRAIPSAARRGMRPSTRSSSLTKSDSLVFHATSSRCMAYDVTRHAQRRRHRSGSNVLGLRRARAAGTAGERLCARIPVAARGSAPLAPLGTPARPAIADSLRLPKDLVRQQLLDALSAPRRRRQSCLRQ